MQLQDAAIYDDKPVCVIWSSLCTGYPGIAVTFEILVGVVVWPSESVAPRPRTSDPACGASGSAATSTQVQAPISSFANATSVSY